jgi:ADP-ribose pyrophosphatase YjhB (NUDIX family)
MVMTPADNKGNFVRQVPDGDTHEREVCAECGFIRYDNPKVVTGSLVVEDGRILLCRRAIEPRTGYWTLPAGYMELGETAEDAARREAREEAEADIVIERLFAVYSIPRIAQVQVMFLARLAGGHVAPGIESQEVGFFDLAEVPWADLAFPSVRWALTQYGTLGGRRDFTPFTNPPGERGEAV